MLLSRRDPPATQARGLDVALPGQRLGHTGTAYSVDFRRKVLAAKARESLPSGAAVRFGAGKASLVRWSACQSSAYWRHRFSA